MVFDPGSAAHLVRLEARSGALSGPTANLAPGFVQANLAILPRELATLPEGAFVGGSVWLAAFTQDSDAPAT